MPHIKIMDSVYIGMEQFIAALDDVRDIDDMLRLLQEKKQKLIPTIQLTKAEIALVNGDCIIDAIKSVRARLNLGLKEAKDIVDIYRGIKPFKPTEY